MTSRNTSEELRSLFKGLALPVMAAPMFLVSTPELVSAASRAGVIGAYAAPNARSIEVLDTALGDIARAACADGGVPWALNMIVHSSYDRFDAELELLKKYKPAVVTTALGSPRRVLEAVHGYGGFVMADVIDVRLARKAVEAGVDGLILVTSGAGGHTGTYHPFAFLEEVRKFWSGPIGLAGAVSTGTHIRAAQLIGADFAVLGTRFIATPESAAMPEYRKLLVQSAMEDLVLSKAVSGVSANWLRSTLDAAGITHDQLKEETKIDFSGDISIAPKAWKDVWSAGHGVGAIDAIKPVSEVVDQLVEEYCVCLTNEREELRLLERLYLDDARETSC